MQTATQAVPPDVAARLCREIQESRRIWLFSQCWGCVKFSKGDPRKMCGEIVNCNLVQARYRRSK